MLKKANWLLFLLIPLFVITILTACGGATEEPAIKIHYGSEELEPIYYGDLDNEDQEDIEKRLKDFMIGKRFSDLPTVAYGDPIQLEALNFETAAIEIYDFVLDEKANIISEYTINPVSIHTVNNGLAEFTLDESLNLEMSPVSTIEGNLIHAILIRCEIDNHSFAFSTLVLGE